MKALKYRQVHLDAHNSEYIPDVGGDFDKTHWQRTLRRARVDSITCFSCCHHGWSYHPTSVGTPHPALRGNLLRQQIDAGHEIGVEVPIYLTAGLNNRASELHPEWREITAGGGYAGWSRSPLEPGFHKMCFNTPYLDYLRRLIEEAVSLFPDADGVFLDIVHQGECCCPKCMRDMLAAGLNPSVADDRKHFAAGVLTRYFEITTAAARGVRPELSVFHNSGHFGPAWMDKLKYFSHLELESLPTGGWGYDHFPLAAAFAEKTGLPFSGMTGKFHSGWGEFGGYKHPNALRYECGVMLASGARCSIGDQLHPCGRLNESAYRAIGAAYAEVEAKEPWCAGSRRCAEVGLLIREGFCRSVSARNFPGDIGAGRLLLEGHLQFDVLAPEMDFSTYKMLILPDEVPVDETLRDKLRKYLALGGKLLLTAGGARNPAGGGFWLDIGAEDAGPGEYDPTYLLPDPEFVADFCTDPFVVYGPARKLDVHGGRILSRVAEPYFNRDFRHFSSHQHTPNRPELSPWPGAVRQGNVICLAHELFGIYRHTGAVVIRQHLTKLILSLLGAPLVSGALPSSARVALRELPESGTLVLHLSYADRVVRGGDRAGDAYFERPIEIIEDLTPLSEVPLSVAVAHPVHRVELVPQRRILPFECADGRCRFTVPEILCHQMVAIS